MKNGAVRSVFILVGIIVVQFGLYQAFATSCYVMLETPPKPCPHTRYINVPCYPLPATHTDIPDIREDCGQFTASQCASGAVSFNIFEGRFGTKNIPESNGCAQQHHSQADCYAFTYCILIEGGCFKSTDRRTRKHYIFYDADC
jgi:hypothetical protein